MTEVKKMKKRQSNVCQIPRIMALEKEKESE